MDVRELYEPWTDERLILDSVQPYEENLVVAERFVCGLEDPPSLTSRVDRRPF
jgi:hypothetical protein